MTIRMHRCNSGVTSEIVPVQQQYTCYQISVTGNDNVTIEVQPYHQVDDDDRTTDVDLGYLPIDGSIEMIGGKGIPKKISGVFSSIKLSSASVFSYIITEIN